MDTEQMEARTAPPEPTSAMQSAEIGKLAEALAKAQSKLEQPHKNKKATIEGTSKSSGKKFQYSYDYADLPAVIDSLKKALSENAISYVQRTRIDSNRLVLETRLMHASGQWIASEWPLEVSKDPKETASSVTYGRRYSLTSLCGISAEETDDDAERRNSGKDEPVVGALTKAKLTQKMREFDTDLQQIEDEDHLAGLLHDYKDALAQCERDLPSWYYTKDGSDALGINDRIERKKRDLANPPESGPPDRSPADRYFAQTDRNIAECKTTEDLDALEGASQEHIAAFDDDTLARRLKNKFAERRVALGKQ